MRIRWTALIASVAVIAMSLPACADEPVPSPLSPEDSLKHIAVGRGWKVELVAAEPLIVDPVAFDWAEDGRLWVVEMRDYPSGLDGKPGSRVKALEDTDGDGRYDKATVLADDLAYCNGICAWHKGVIVTAAPAIIYLEDTSGVGKADIRKPLYTGFTEGNPQLRINGLRWGIDGWLYCGNGIQSAGKIKSEATGETIEIGGRDLRIQPDTGKMEALTGPSQFGREHDDFGHWFGCQNAKPLIHYLMEDADLRRNPAVVPPDVRLHVPMLPAPGPIYPRSRPGKFHHVSQLGHFTSCCGIAIYRDNLAGEAFQNNVFICEPANNLVHREIMTQKGALFTSRRADDELTSEWLASDDTWFRPVMARLGPDGALWIADMYREIIDHPQYIPKEQQAGLNFRTGDDRGRLYRVVPEGKPRRLVPRLDVMAPPDVARLLESKNGTMRDMAQRRIVSEKLKSAKPRLMELCVPDDYPPASQIQALWTLALLEDLPAGSELLADAQGSDHAGVAAQGIRIARHAKGAVLRQFLENQRMGIGSEEPEVRIQIALASGDLSGDDKDAAIAADVARHVLFFSHDDSWPTAAAISSLGDGRKARAVLRGIEVSKLTREQWQRLQQVARPIFDSILASRDKAKEPGLPSEMARFLLDVFQADQVAVRDLYGVAGHWHEALAKHGVPWDTLGQGPQGKELVEASNRFRQNAAAILGSREIEPDVVIACLRLLGWSDESRDRDRQLAADRLSPQSPTSVQLAALGVLVRIRGDSLTDTLLAGWPSHSPALRAEIFNLLLSREPLVKSLLDSIEAGKFPGTDIDAARRQRLLQHANAEIRARATKLLAESAISSRREALQAFAPTLQMSGASARGQEIFNKRCTSCHVLGGKGAQVGPDLLGLTDRSYPTLLVAILDPNRNVEARWLNYIVVTKDGRTFAGLLADETGASITLIDAEGKKQSLLRSEIEELKSSGKSLMPEGLEKDLKPQEVADLMEFVRRGGLK